MEISLHHPAEASAYQVQKLDKVPPAYAHLKVPVTNEMRLIEGDFGFVFSQFNQIKDNGIYKFDLKLKKDRYLLLGRGWLKRSCIMIPCILLTSWATWV